MENNSSALVMRIFVSSTDKHKDGLIYEYIVLKAKEYGLAGATVFKGILGYGASSVIHSYKFWEVSEKLPVAIEIIDEEKKILSFYDTIKPVLETIRYGCLVTIEKTNVMMYKSGIKP